MNYNETNEGMKEQIAEAREILNVFETAYPGNMIARKAIESAESFGTNSWSSEENREACDASSKEMNRVRKSNGRESNEFLSIRAAHYAAMEARAASRK